MALSLASADAHASIRLDLLSACDDLGLAMRELKRPTIGCRAPRSAMERALATRIGINPAVRLCFLQRAPSASLSRFACVTFHTATSAHLDCIAPVASADVDDYQRNYASRYAAHAKAYLEAANRCALGNGDASRAQWSLMSPYLNFIAQFELGFVLPLGNGLVGSSTVLHGFGGVDPEISGSEGDMIEFFSTYVPPRTLNK
jgi:hypothetical protein